MTAQWAYILVMNNTKTGNEMTITATCQDYEAANDAFNVVNTAYRATADDYHGGKISDEEFLKARAENDAALVTWEAAFDIEAERLDAEEVAKDELENAPDLRQIELF